MRSSTDHQKIRLYPRPLNPIALAILCAFGTPGVTAADLRPVASRDLPQGGQIAAGQGSINVTGATMDIRQQSPKLIANWQSFNIGSEGTVNFVQPGASAAALNRIVGQDPSQIYGRLNANGQVFLINPNGVLFGRSATVNVGGLTASTLNITDENFLAGRQVFERNGATGKIENYGSLKAADGGYLALLAPEVRNGGALVANMGTVAMAGGDKVTLEFSGSRLISVTVQPATIAALIDNQNLIDVGGGQVIISTAAANQLLGATVNNDGVISASSVTAEGGRVFLKGEIVRNHGQVKADGLTQGGQIEATGKLVYSGGELTADGATGGRIQVSGSDITTGGRLSATGHSGAGGEVSLAASRELWQTQATRIDVSGATGGRVDIDGGQQLVSSATVQADGHAGGGGQVNVTADFVQLLSADLQANGQTSGGQVRVGGEWQGGKNAAIDEVRNAQVVAINDTTRLSAKANSGTGGEVVVWSDQRTTMLGQAEASGAAGKGGRIEVSSAGELTTTANLNAGSGGQVLLDPKNLIIDDISSTETTATQYDLAFRVEGGDPAQTVVRNINGLAWGGTADAQPSVALSQQAGRVVIGSPKEDAAYIYGINPENPSAASGTVLISRLSPAAFPSIQSGSRFGESVAIDRPGQYVAVGAPDSVGKNGVRGTAHVFKSAIEGIPCVTVVGAECFKETFKPVQELYATGSTGAAGKFGLGVALSGGQSSHRLFVSSSEGTGQIYQYDEQPDGVMSSSATRIITALPFNNERIGPYIAADSSGNLFYNFDHDDSHGESIARISPPYDGPRFTVTSCLFENLCGAVGTSADGKFLLSSSRFRNSINLDSFASLGEMDSSGQLLEGGVRFGLGNWGTRPHLIPKGVAEYSQITGVAVGEGARPLFAIAWSGNPRSDSYGGNVVSLFRLNPGTAEPTQSVTSQRFSDNPTATNTISAAAVQNLLSTGSSLTLQANNDLTVNAPVTVNNPSGNGGELILQAGRSVFLNKSLTTDNGNLTVVANETNANGVIADNRNAGAAVITMANGTKIDAGSGQVSLTLASGAGRSGDFSQSGDISLGSISAGRISVVNDGPSKGNVVLQNGASIAASATGNALVLAAASGGNFINHGASVTAANGRWLIYSANPALNTFGGLSSGQQPLWNRFYSTVPPESVTEGDNRYLFEYQPELRVSYSGSAQPVTRQYDGTSVGVGQLSGSVNGIANVTGLVTETYGGAYRPGTVEEVLTGLNATVELQEGGPFRNVGTYQIGYRVSGSQTPTSPTGYKVITSGSGSGQVSLEITPAPLVISTSDVVKTYDGTTNTQGDNVTKAPIAVAVNDTRLFDTDTLLGGSFAFADKNAGENNKTVTVAGVTVRDGNEGKNYQPISYRDNTTSTIKPAPLSITTADITKTYDGSTIAIGTPVASGLFGSDEIAAGWRLEFADKNAGTGKTVKIADVSVKDGNAGANYTVRLLPNTTSTIKPAPLLINLTETQCRIEGQGIRYDYSLAGFVAGETEAQVGVAGSPTFSLDSGQLKAGTQQVTMTGTGDLSASNYSFVLGKAIATVSVYPGVATTYELQTQADMQLTDNSPPETAKLAADFVADKANNARFVSLASARTSGVVGNGSALANYIGARYAERQERFSDAINVLESNPSRADLAECTSGDAPETLCIPPVGSAQFGSHPSAEIQRKVAYFFANQKYEPSVGELGTPSADAQAIAKILEEQYGYEVHIVHDATRRDMVLTLKKAVEAHARDESVLIYYAGHGVEFREKQSGEMMGYWIPVDGNTRNPRTWLSNTDIGKFMQLLPSKQVMLVSDSCFSGRLAVEQKLEKGDIASRRAELLAKRSVTVMSSGNFEEVDDAGKGDHSIFAWSLIEQLNAAAQSGKLVEGHELFATVKTQVHGEGFPQTPQYSALLSAGYERGGEFFLEKR